jgi:hypothetical protein
MHFRLFACLVVLFSNLLTMAQRPDMTQWLNIGTSEERVQKLVSLGVEREAAETAVFEQNIEWQPIRSGSRHELAILFLPCNGLAAAYLHLLERTDNGWRVSSRAGFDCHYDQSVSFETAPLRKPNIDDVLVHHECEERGTGIVQQNFNVFAVSSGRLKLVLNTEEVIHASGVPIGSYELRQRSRFMALPATQPGAAVIEETRCRRLNGKLSIHQRHFSWNASSSRLVPSAFVKVAAVGEKTSAACDKSP